MAEYEVKFPGEEPQKPRRAAKRSPFADSPFMTAQENQPLSPEPVQNTDEIQHEQTISESEIILPVEEIPAENISLDEIPAEEAPAEETVTQPVFEPVMTDPAPRKTKKTGMPRKRIIAALLVLALVATGCGITAACVNTYWTGYHNSLVGHINTLYERIENLQQKLSNSGTGNSVSGSPNTNPAGLTPAQVYAQRVDTVVAITANYSSVDAYGSSMGSGFIISADGYIITNHHVVAGASEIIITTHQGEEYTATLIGTHEANDLAVLKVEAIGLPVAPLGSSTDLIVGDMVVAIGNPLGTLSATLTAGYVSGKDRTISTDGSVINMIQTDAAINSGNSGGPLFNMKGEVIGITSAKYSGTTSSGASIEGIGFAIPIDDVKETIQYIQENGSIARPYMGVEITNQYDGIGVYVRGVDAGGAAENAGIKPGDLIISVDGTPVKTIEELTSAINSYRVGDIVSITVYRNGKILNLRLIFGEKPAN